MIAPDRKFIRTKDVVTADMDGELVMMHVEKGAYFAIGGSGGHLWAQLAQPRTMPELVASIEEEFETGEVEDLEGTVSCFLSDMLAQGLVVAAD